MFDIDRVEHGQAQRHLYANRCPWRRVHGHVAADAGGVRRSQCQSERLREGLRKIVADVALKAGSLVAAPCRASSSPVFRRELPSACGGGAGGMVERMMLAQKLLLAEAVDDARRVRHLHADDNDDIDFTLAGTRRALTRMKQL